VSVVADELPALSELPETVAEFGRAVRIARARLIEKSAFDQAAGDRLLPAVQTIAGSSFDWRLFLQRRQDRTVFFFFHKPGDTKVVLDARLKVRVVAEARFGDAPAPAPPTELVLVHPPVLLHRPTPEDWRRATGAPTRPRAGLIFRVGREGRGRVAMTRVHGKEPRLFHDGREVKKIPRTRFWPFAALREVADALGGWVSGGADRGVEEVLLGPRLGAPGSDATEVVVRLVEAHDRVRESLRRDGPAPMGDLGLAEFDSSVLLRLDPNGDLAKSYDDEDEYITLKLAVGLTPARDRSRLRIRIAIPDYLVSGELRTAFREALKEPPAIADLRELLPGAKPSVNAVKAFVDSAFAGRSLVFRCRRQRDHDVEMLLLRGDLRGRPAVVVFRGKFRVRPRNEKDKVVYLEGSLKRLTGDEGGFSPTTVRRSFANHLFRVARNLFDWTRAQ
jgi:hypothetical protein